MHVWLYQHQQKTRVLVPTLCQVKSEVSYIHYLLKPSGDLNLGPHTTSAQGEAEAEGKGCSPRSHKTVTGRKLEFIAPGPTVSTCGPPPHTHTRELCGCLRKAVSPQPRIPFGEFSACSVAPSPPDKPRKLPASGHLCLPPAWMHHPHRPGPQAGLFVAITVAGRETWNLFPHRDVNTCWLPKCNVSIKAVRGSKFPPM